MGVYYKKSTPQILRCAFKTIISSLKRRCVLLFCLFGFGGFYTPLSAFLLRLDLYLIKTFAIHTNDLGLRYKGVGVDALNDAENVGAFALLGQYDQYFSFSLGVPSLTVQYGHATMCAGDAGGDVLVVLGKDEELYRLARAVNDIIHHDTECEEQNETIEQVGQAAVGQYHT